MNFFDVLLSGNGATWGLSWKTPEEAWQPWLEPLTPLAVVPEEVSVIVLSGPAEQGDLGRALDSIRLQTQRPSETLLLDDPAHPVTRTWPGVTVVPRTGLSRAAALNQGWMLARHDLLAFADPWDVWPTERLDRQLAVLQGHPEVDAVLGHVQPLTGRWAPASSADFHLGSALIRRSVFSRVGLFDEAHPMTDQEWLTRVREMGLNVVVQEDITLWAGVPPAPDRKKRQDRLPLERRNH